MSCAFSEKQLMCLNILLAIIIRVAVVQKNPRETFISLLYLQLDTFLLTGMFLSFTSLFLPQIWTKESYVQAARFFRQETRSIVKDAHQTETKALTHLKRLFLEKVAKILNWNRSGNRKKAARFGRYLWSRDDSSSGHCGEWLGPKGWREWMKIHILSSDIYE